MSRDIPLYNQLKEARTRMGISQAALAAAVGVTRQTIGGIEAGAFSPSVHVALRIAHVLGCRVEDLFWLDPEGPPLDVHVADDGTLHSSRVTLARIGQRWMAYPLADDGAFRTEMIPADGIVQSVRRGSQEATVMPLDALQHLERTVVLAGCTPALSLWARAAERWQPSLRIHWMFANSERALVALARGEVHGAGTHLYDPSGREDNVAHVRRMLPDEAVVLVNLGVWAEGLAVAPGNPLGVRSAADLARPDVRIVNREKGAGARLILDAALQEAGIDGDDVPGFHTFARDHIDVARRVASGSADAGVTVEAVAFLYGLDFIPLRQVRYDIAFRKDSLSFEPVVQLLETLQHPRVRAQLEYLGGYDTRRTGDIVAETG